MKRALVVIDYQNDFVSGTLGSEAARSIEGALCARVKEEISDGYDVFYSIKSRSVEDHNPLNSYQNFYSIR